MNTNKSSIISGYKNLPLCLELMKWRDDEIKNGSMGKAKKIQSIIVKYWPW
jgi:mannose/fructose-specific phosphotransferase system component IIA